MAFRVCLRDFQGLRGNICSYHRAVAAFPGDGDGNGPATGAQIKDFNVLFFHDALQRGLHEQFRFGPGNQHVFIDHELQRPELLFTRDMGKGRAPGPA